MPPNGSFGALDIPENGIKIGRGQWLSSYCCLHALRPVAQGLVAQTVDHFAFDPVRLRADGLEACEGLAHAAAAGGGEGDDSLAGQVAALEEGIDDRRRDIPPDGEADEDRVVAGKVRAALGDLRPGGRGFT